MHCSSRNGLSAMTGSHSARVELNVWHQIPSPHIQLDSIWMCGFKCLLPAFSSTRAECGKRINSAHLARVELNVSRLILRPHIQLESSWMCIEEVWCHIFSSTRAEREQMDYDAAHSARVELNEVPFAHPRKMRHISRMGLFLYYCSNHCIEFLYGLQNVHTREPSSWDIEYSNAHHWKSTPHLLQHSVHVKVNKDHTLAQNTRRFKQEVSEIELTYSRNACAILGCMNTVFKP